jgi:adenosine deaminase/aminodeoxyfutalosine deaminase
MRPSYHDWPKAELHLHLEGSVDAATLMELAPGLSAGAAEAMYRFDGFAGFLQSFAAVVKSLETPEDYGLVTRRLLEKLEAENVRYAEVILSAGVVLWKKQEFGPVFDAIADAAEGSPVRVRWIVDAVRQFGADHAMEVAQLAAARTGRGVIGFGIGGDEERGPAAWFGEVYKFARRSGLHLTAHAGESAGPESVWGALELGAERIGHGVRAIDDPVLVKHLREHGIPLEISITSNLVTGVIGSLDEHPVRRLFDAGVPLTLNTDDPAMFGTTLSREYEVAARHFGFSEAELREVARNGFRYAFDPAARAAAI